ncbi:MAG: DUF4126 domain-containing protein [Acidobacteria bacterium]|nr:MAG: DUF4126 domain-containing protein [Acidobacteriota bacterium]REK00309.1 MAG: DUF4126 domain-containing protein [Acidobacteriota bacterium]
MEVLMSVGLGLGLAAACGFRVFVPFLAMSIASRAGHLDLSERFDWIASDVALGVLALATVLEIGSYYVPWLDNLLDTVATPAAVVAGTVAAAATFQGTSPLLGWTLAAIGGGGAAGVLQTGTTLLRGLSSISTAGFGNPILSTAEAGGAASLASLALLLPLVALLVVMTLVLTTGVKTARFLGAREQRRSEMHRAA